ncbi:MAG: hypothetical protein ACLUZ6_04945 [Lachnospira eligens]
MRQEKMMLDYVADFSWYEKVEVNGQRYLLVHGGLGNFDIKRDIDDYSLDELEWSRVDYDVRYFGCNNCHRAYTNKIY